MMNLLSILLFYQYVGDFFSQVKIVEYIVVALRRASSGVSQEYLVVLVRWVRQ